MSARQIARDGEPKSNPAGLEIAAFIEAVERAEGFLASVGCDAGAVRGDEDAPKGVGARHGRGAPRARGRRQSRAAGTRGGGGAEVADVHGRVTGRIGMGATIEAACGVLNSVGVVTTSAGPRILPS